MPRGDRTGPEGMGPMTGRAAGFCAGYDTPGYANPVSGRGFGRMGRGMGRQMRRGFGGGFGRGFGRNAWAAAAQPVPPVTGAITPENEKQMLEDEASFLEDQLSAIKKRIEDIGKE